MKNKKGSGSFNKLPNGTFEFTVSVGNDEYGKRQRKKFYGKTEGECRKKYKEFIKEGEKPAKVEEYTLSQWLDVWLSHKEKNVKEYTALVSRIKGHRISDIKISRVKPIHVTEFFTDLTDYSHSVRKKTRFVLTSAFESALDNDYCNRNPVKRATIANKQPGEKDPFTERETKVILEFAKSDKLFGVPMYIMLNSGIRSGEMRALLTDSVDFENNIIKIDKAVKESGELGLPKNNKPRIVPLGEEVSEFLREKLHGKSGYIISGDYYVTQHGFRGRYAGFFRRLNAHLEKNGLQPIECKSPHSTRHADVNPATHKMLHKDLDISSQIFVQYRQNKSVFFNIIKLVFLIYKPICTDSSLYINSNPHKYFSQLCSMTVFLKEVLNLPENLDPFLGENLYPVNQCLN